MTDFRCARCQRQRDGERVTVGSRIVCQPCAARAARSIDRTRDLTAEPEHEATCEPTPVMVSQVARVRGAPIVVPDRSKIRHVRER